MCIIHFLRIKSLGLDQFYSSSSLRCLAKLQLERTRLHVTCLFEYYVIISQIGNKTLLNYPRHHCLWRIFAQHIFSAVQWCQDQRPTVEPDAIPKHCKCSQKEEQHNIKWSVKLLDFGLFQDIIFVVRWILQACGETRWFFEDLMCE